MLIMPNVIHTTKSGTEVNCDLASRLLQERIIMLFAPIDQDISCSVISQLLYLESLDPKRDIRMYINSPGGEVQAGLAILDVMDFLSCDVSTTCVGAASSMGAVLLAGGTKGKRAALAHSEMMIHQPLGGVSGQVSDVVLHTQHMCRTKDVLDELLSGFTGQSLDRIREDTDRDRFMSAREALDYGLIDRIVLKEKKPYDNA